MWSRSLTTTAGCPAARKAIVMLEVTARAVVVALLQNVKYESLDTVLNSIHVPVSTGAYSKLRRARSCAREYIGFAVPHFVFPPALGPGEYKSPMCVRTAVCGLAYGKSMPVGAVAADGSASLAARPRNRPAALIELRRPVPAVRLRPP
jgi:hypothetical protein